MNEDLNNLTEPGTYYSKNDATTGSLTNCPLTTLGFTMTVNYSTGNDPSYICQTIYGRTTSFLPIRYVRYKSGSNWGEWYSFSDDATNKIPCSNITYSSDNKESAMNLVNNPTKIFGERDTPYCIIFNDSVGDSIFSGGKSAIFGYTYYNDTHGAQLVMRYGMRLRYRTKTSGTWAGLKNITLA